MTFFLRKISKNRWFERNPCWLQGDDVPADPLGDLRTKRNKLSVWLVEDTERSQMEAAIAITTLSDNVSHVHYALIERDALEGINITARQDPSDTHYLKVKDLHRNLVQLSGSKLIQLTRVIFESKKTLIPKDRLLPALARAVEEGEIAKSALKKHVVEDIEKQIARRQTNG